jgi:hypothetical protein
MMRTPRGMVLDDVSVQICLQSGQSPRVYLPLILYHCSAGCRR